uniref:HEAT repeat-containing protein 6-like n=1 Tax=Ciona intestinalis TaxID=7719 RepID=UPI000180C899|nr:HEAT repeat-containing protein 6-like [Ciona intestinalis]|eukprot:XP_002125317.1 HEAT repeat-containing protein 6-like [Ciona intestinalis]
MESQNEQFKKLYLQLMEAHLNNNFKYVQDLVNKLNSLNYHESMEFITKRTCTDLILHLLNVISECGLDAFDILPFLNLMNEVSTKQGIVVCQYSVNVIVQNLKSIWFQILSLKSSENAAIGLITAVAAVTYGNGSYVSPELLDWVIGTSGNSASIGALILSDSTSIHAKKACLQCLSGLCLASESRVLIPDERKHRCLQLFIHALQTTPSLVDVPHYRVFFAAYKGLQLVLQTSTALINKEIGPLLAVLKKHLVFSLNESNLEFPTELHPVPIPTVHPVTKMNERGSGSIVSDRKKKKSKRGPLLQQSTGKPRKQPEEVPASSTEVPDEVLASSANQFVSSSESEFSDTEGGFRRKMGSLVKKIRQFAMNSLQIVVSKTKKHILFGYWNSFFPSTDSENNISLLSCITDDSSTKMQVAALITLCGILDGSKSFLSLAALEIPSASFVSYSSMLGSSIHKIHGTLLYSLSKEKSHVIQVHLLKAIGMLAENTPYSKLNTGLVESVVSKVRIVLSTSQSNDCKIASFNVFSSLLSNTPALAEMVCSITSTTFQDLSLNVKPNSISRQLADVTLPQTTLTSSWLVDECISICLSTEGEFRLSLHIAAIQTLSSAAKFYFPVVKSYVNQLTDLICNLLKSANLYLRAAKLLENLAESMLRNSQNDPGQVNENLVFWNKLLSGPLQSLLQQESDWQLHTIICVILSTIGPEVFNQLNSSLQRFCQTMLLGLTNDEDYSVRFTAIRSLAVYIMYPCLRKDTGFVEDMAGCVLRLMEDEFRIVQNNAAWSFGNLTDAMVLNAESSPDFLDSLSASFLLSLLEAGIKAVSGKDKLRFNMMRVLGNLLRVMQTKHVTILRFRKGILKAKSIIISSMLSDSSMKVKWNACLACGNYLHNNLLPIGESSWTDDVYDALCKTVSTSKNFKVRNKASLAICSVRNREGFGSKFTDVCVSIINCLRHADSDELGLAEYNFKEKLQEQLIYTLLYLIPLTTKEDILTIAKTLVAEDNEQLHFQLNHWYNVLLIRMNPSPTKAISHTETEDKTQDGLQEYVTSCKMNDTDKLNLFKSVIEPWQTVLKHLDSANNEIDLNKLTQLFIVQ